VLALREAIAAADAVLIATPEYNGTLPGQLKNALDWVSRPVGTSPLRGKPVAVIGASTGMFGAVWAQADARKVLGLIGARVLDRELPVAQAHETLRDDGLPHDDALREALAELLGELHTHAGEVATSAHAVAGRSARASTAPAELAASAHAVAGRSARASTAPAEVAASAHAVAG
jgi:chromate reductase, NAD(P)H dehydrogenase (quinone)